MQLTEEQIAKLTVHVEQDSQVLCLVCLANAGVEVGWDEGQLPLAQLSKFKSCMVVPGPHWACPQCNTRLKEGRGWGKCPCCKTSRPARRTRWTYIVDCSCIETEAQRKATAEADEVRRRYYERENRPAMEKAAAKAAAQEQAQAEAVAFAAAREEAVECLADMPNQTCTKPENNLPHSYCCACPRFDHKRKQNQPPPKQQPARKSSLEQSQPKVSTPARDQTWEDRPGWRDKVKMEDAVSDAFGDW